MAMSASVRHSHLIGKNGLIHIAEHLHNTREPGLSYSAVPHPDPTGVLTPYSYLPHAPRHTTLSARRFGW